MMNERGICLGFGEDVYGDGDGDGEKGDDGGGDDVSWMGLLYYLSCRWL